MNRTEKVCVFDLATVQKKEKLSKGFIEKLKDFTNDKFDFYIKWNTKKVKSLFKLKSNNPHPSCKIYEETCSCGETYIGETKRNVEVQF